MSSQIVASESITQAYLLPTKSEETISEEFVKSIWSLYIEWNANCLKYSLAVSLSLRDLFKESLRIANETLEIYSPIAERMGMQEIRSELDDLCFKILEPGIRDSIIQRLNQIILIN